MIKKILIFNTTGWNQSAASLVEGLKLNKDLELFSTTKSNYGADILIKSRRHYSYYPLEIRMWNGPPAHSLWVQSFVMDEDDYVIECQQLMDECDLIVIFDVDDQSHAYFRNFDEHVLPQKDINQYTKQGVTLRHEGEMIDILHKDALDGFRDKVVTINTDDFSSVYRKYGTYEGGLPQDCKIYFKREKDLNIEWPANVEPMPFSAEERYFTGGKDFDKIWDSKNLNMSCLFRANSNTDRLPIRNELVKQYGEDKLCVMDSVFGRKKNDGLDEVLEGVDIGNCVRHHHLYFDAIYDAKINIEGPPGGRAFYTGRMMESLANGCCYFYPTPNYNVDFPNELIDGEDFIIYHNLDDLIEKIEYYLSHEEEMKAVAQNGFNKLLKYHTSEVRAKEFIETCERYMG